MHTFTINGSIGPIIQRGWREDGLPETIEWRGQVFDVPDLDTLEGWVFDSVVETLEGDMIEPDGWNVDGCPSWLLALNLV